MKDALDVMVQQGVASLATLPYSDSACFSPSPNSLFFLDGYHKLSVQDSNAIKTELNNFNVLPIGMNVYQDFEQLQGATIYVHPAGDTSCALGGHCMAIVGYDDNKSAYRIMNSWGTSWCDAGFTWIDYGTFARVVTEVYAPYAHPSMRSTLISSPSNQSGSISAVSAASRTWLNETTSHFDTLVFFFQLSDWINANFYRLRAIDSSNVSTDIYSGTLGQVLRGSYFEVPLGSHGDNAALLKTRYFALDITGVSRYSENISLTLFSQYPDPGGR
ncbi:hypothetical protein PTKU15_10760 [Paraburkholderia terrae]|nr:hypothetical protein PTKU15_10760 [Paraburkholderia terrae]